jgi:type IV pilus assembly protein PilA
LAGTARSRVQVTASIDLTFKEEDPSVLYRLRNRLNGEEGFTLVELLVVILIIGILAAIAIPSFLNQKGKGEDAAAKSSAREAATAVETYYTDNASYGATGAQLRSIEPTLPPDTDTTAKAPGGMVISNTNPAQDYSITVYSKPSGRGYTIVKNAAGVSRSCDAPGKGGCNASGSW